MTLISPQQSLRPPMPGAPASVLVNGRYAGKRLTGVQRYAQEIVARLGERCDVLQTGAKDGLQGHAWEQAVLPCKLGGRLLWSPCNTGPLAVARQVLTIHDTSFADTPECFSRAFRQLYQTLLPRLARRVRRVMTVSEFSRQRIAEVTGLSVDRIDVVHNGVSARFARTAPETVQRLRSRLNLHGPYVLTLGSVEPRKNLAALLKAWPAVIARRPDLTLAIAGSLGGANSAIFKGDGGAAMDLPSVRRLGYVADSDLPALYSGCEAFAFPSLYEGFGLPPLEAMACGAAVVCSNTTALPETVGDAALLVSPHDPEAIAASILQVCDDESMRSDLGRRGVCQAARFTWEESAEKVWSILRNADR